MEAPVTASQGAMRSLPMKLESLLSGPEQGLRAEEKKKLRILQGDLQGLIDNYLLEPSEVESPASTASSWMEGVRDLSYDIDDFIYELAHVAGGGARINFVQKPPRFKISRFSEKLRRRQWITDDISGFRTRVEEAIQRHTQYLGNCKLRPSSSGKLLPPSLPSGEAATHLVGVDSSIEQLCGWLANDGQPEHKVASIVGPGGFGKTTLAKQVYRMLGGQFDCLAFVQTSPKPDMKGLLTSILSQVRRHGLPDDDTCNVHDLVLNINAHLQDKTYLIVIEDLWALSTWDLINRSLPKGNHCSRILTTTEVEIIAQACCADNSKCIPAKKEDDSRYIIKKKPLSEDESRELFLSTAFGKQAECPQHLKEVSNEIIKRSGGLPLAINILASLLARQPASNIEQWHYIKNSLSPALITSSCLERINQALNIGYHNLPHCLKACMLYLCLYEEGCVIWKDDLMKQWIAEDFICAVEGDDREEVARSYFGELVSRGMIQPVDLNCNDEIMSCTVHQMVFHFIRDKSMEENFCIAVDHSQTTIRLADKVRRLALHFSNVEDATPPGPESMRLSKLKSVAFSGFPNCMPSIVDFRFLQVLILKLLVHPDNMSDSLTASDDPSGNITEPDDLIDNLSEPDDLGYNLTGLSELFRLRYFHLDACHMSVALPTKMQQLKDLVAWEIDAEVTAVPSDIVDLPGLLYLSIPSEAYLPTGIGCMTSLRTLGVFDLSKNSTETVMGLCELTNLHELRLTCDTLQHGNLEKNLNCLGVIVQKLRNLKRVTLVPAASSLVNTQDDGGSSSMIISWPGFSIQPLSSALLQTLELSRRCCIFSSLPEWTKELSKLCILKIAVRELSREDIAILKGLPSLAALSLFISTASASRIMFDDEGFSVLKYFKFVCAAPCLQFLDGAMPKVRKLKLGFNANRMKGYNLDYAGFGRLTGLNEISTKIGCSGAGENDRRFARSVLTDAIDKHPSTHIINVQCVDWNFCDEDEKYIDELDSTLHLQTTDVKLSLIEEHTDGIEEKPEVGSGGTGGYGETYKLQMVQAITELERMLIDESAEPKSIPLSLLKYITNGFSDDRQIGQGGFASVYKGMLDNDTIAVKKLHALTNTDKKEFIEEICCLMKIKHKNIVRFLGYCSETRGEMVHYQGDLVMADVQERLLCFEYLPKGSLDKQITDASCGLEWRKRYEIINGICDGVHHLHRKRIVHLDLNPTNILLDDNMTPKIAGFGLSTRFGVNQSQFITSNLCGTMGYMAPELINDQLITFKTDIYSLGVTIVQILTGERGYTHRTCTHLNVIKTWINRLEETQKHTQLVQVRVCIEIAKECMDYDPEKRPDIQQIIDRLGATRSVEEFAPSSHKGDIVTDEMHSDLL